MNPKQGTRARQAGPNLEAGLGVLALGTPGDWIRSWEWLGEVERCADGALDECVVERETCDE